MPETAFILQEDEALKAYLSGLTLTDGSSPPGGRSIPVWYRDPEMELNNRQLPFILIDLVDISESTERGRHNNGRLKVDALPYKPPGHIYGSDQDNTFLAERPVPVNLDYQVTTHCRTARQDRQLWGYMWQKFPGRWGALHVLGDDTARSMFLLGTANSTEIDDEGKRLFRRMFTVRILSEMWSANIKLVSNIHDITVTITIPIDVTLVESELNCNAE